MNFLIGLVAAIGVVTFIGCISTYFYFKHHQVYLMPVLNTLGTLHLSDNKGVASVVTINEQTDEVSIVSTRTYRYLGFLIPELEYMNHRLREEYLQHHQSAKDIIYIYKVRLNFEYDTPRVTTCLDVKLYRKTKQKGPQTVDAEGKESPMYKLEQVTRPPVERLR